MSKVIKGIGSIFKAPKIPSTTVTPMPDPGAFAQKLAARKDQRKKKKERGGREGTIKTPTYSGTNLGGTN